MTRFLKGVGGLAVLLGGCLLDSEPMEVPAAVVLIGLIVFAIGYGMEVRCYTR